MRKAIAVVVVLVIAFLAPHVALGASLWAEKATYKDQIIGKLEFGVKNTLGGWTALISEPVNAENNFQDTFRGIGVGIYHAAAYTFGGLLHLVTFFVPQVDVPLPNNGVSLD